MRIAIVGAGAIGCFLAARLSQHGHDVMLVGRPMQVEAIRHDGLLVREPKGRERRYALRAVTSLEEAPEFKPELVLLAVKTQDLAAACRQLAAYVQGVPVVALQNGLDADRIAAEIVRREDVVSGIVMCAVTYVQTGEITLHFSGWILVGEPDGRVRARTRVIASVLEAAAPTYLTHDVQRARWTKLVSNLNNGICAATGLTLPQLASSEAGRLLSLRVMKEGYRVARAAGVRLDLGLYGLTPRAMRRDFTATVIALLQNAVTILLAVAPEGVAVRVLALAGRSRLNQLPIHFSTWQSIVRGQPSEIEYLNGAVVRAGAKLGIPTPYNVRIVEMVHQAERTATFCAVATLYPDGSPAPAPVRTRGGGS